MRMIEARLMDKNQRLSFSLQGFSALFGMTATELLHGQFLEMNQWNLISVARMVGINFTRVVEVLEF